MRPAGWCDGEGLREGRDDEHSACVLYKVWEEKKTYLARDVDVKEDLVGDLGQVVGSAVV